MLVFYCMEATQLHRGKSLTCFRWSQLRGGKPLTHVSGGQMASNVHIDLIEMDLG